MCAALSRPRIAINDTNKSRRARVESFFFIFCFKILFVIYFGANQQTHASCGTCRTFALYTILRIEKLDVLCFDISANRSSKVYLWNFRWIRRCGLLVAGRNLVWVVLWYWYTIRATSAIRFDSLFLTRAFGVCVLVSIYNIVRNILTINLNSTSSPRPAARRRMNHVFHKHDRHDANNARSKNKIESRHYSRTPSFVVIVIIVIIDDWPRDGHFYGDCMRNFLSFLSKTCILRG